MAVNVRRLSEIAGRWRDEAAILRRRGAIAQAEVLDDVARELTEGIREWREEELTLREAADESGYAYSTLQQYIAEGRLPNAGEEGAPRIRRRDLPHRGNRQSQEDGQDDPGFAEGILMRRLGG